MPTMNRPDETSQLCPPFFFVLYPPLHRPFFSPWLREVFFKRVDYLAYCVILFFISILRACSGSSRSETCIGCFYLVGGPKPGIVFRDWCGDRNTCVGGKQQIIHRWHAFLDHWHDPHTQPCIQLRRTETVVHTHSEAPPSPSGDTF
jgi:hypothetical protein